jgi:hypothetical protein
MIRSLLTPAGDGSGQYTLSQYELLRSMATGPSFNPQAQAPFNPAFNAGAGGFNPQAAFAQQVPNQGMGFGGFDGYGGAAAAQFGGGFMQQQFYH